LASSIKPTVLRGQRSPSGSAWRPRARLALAGTRCGSADWDDGRFALSIRSAPSPP